VKQDESNNDSKFTSIIGLGGNSSNHWKINRRQSWKWKGICRAYTNPILKFDIGLMSSKKRGKTWKAQVVSTTINGMTWSMD
jgi:hypothetical protein